ncbi:MAG TPA: Sec-independent protein translocase protein TatB [Paenalcaligenes sp.]|nr:Sec-independent protein translocase protein TatB [Paenalcaligenes sp.]
MFDISFTELLIIAVVALIVLGPERLPKVARTMGHLLGRAQRYMGDVKRDIQKEMELEDIKDLKEEMQKASSSVKSSIGDLGKEFKDPLKQFESDLKDPFQEARDAVQSLRKETEDSVGDLSKSVTEGLTPDSAESKTGKPADSGESTAIPADTDTPAIKAADTADEIANEAVTKDSESQAQPQSQDPATRPVASKTAAALRSGSGLTEQKNTRTDQPKAKPRHTDLPGSTDAADTDGAD